MTSQTISAIIIDDDPFSRDLLIDLLGKYARNAEIKEICRNGTEGMAAITRLQPDIIFLDVEMPDMSGFEMLRKLPLLQGQVIFSSSHDHYAIRAIRFSALDYLLKPVEGIALQDAVSRAVDKINEKSLSAQYAHLLEQTGRRLASLDNLAVPTMEGLLFLKTEDILRCESDDKYTKIFLADKKMILASRTLGEFEDLLIPEGFARIHHSHLINIKRLKRYIKGEGGQVIMDDGTALNVSRRKKDDLLRIVSQFK